LGADTNTQSQVDATTSDSAVRGGSLFKSFKSSSWRGGDKDNQDIQSVGLSKSYDGSSINQKAMKARSTGSLDVTMRRGQDTAHHAAQGSVSSMVVDQKQLLAPNQRVLEGGLMALIQGSPVHGGELFSKGDFMPTVPIQGGAIIGEGGRAKAFDPAMAASTSAKPRPGGSQRQGVVHKDMKKAFTEFHNSQQYGRDATSPFLGEDKSVSGGKAFTAYSHPYAGVSRQSKYVKQR